MKELKTAQEAKKWLRGLPLMRRELSLKIDFYTDLMRECKRMGTAGDQGMRYYLNQIALLQEQLRGLTGEVERVLNRLDPDERMILTARYVRRLTWDAMEFHVHYSRRQAIRIHDRALKKLAGVRVEGSDYEEKD